MGGYYKGLFRQQNPAFFATALTLNEECIHDQHHLVKLRLQEMMTLNPAHQTV